MPTAYRAAHELGQAAYCLGTPLDCNPWHDMDSDQYRGWRDGWVVMRKALEKMGIQIKP